MNGQPPPPPIDNPPTPPWFHFGDKHFPPARQVTAEHMSAVGIGGVLAVAFDDLMADLQGADAPLSAAVSVFCELPAEVLSNDPFLGYVAHLRGSCMKSAGVRAVVLAQLGGVTHVQSFPYGTEHDGSWFAEVFSFERRPNKDSGQPVIPLPPFTIQVTISVQRLSPEESVLLTLDTIDLSADRG